MTVNFQIDRVDPPIFYTLKEGAQDHCMRPGVDVLAEVGEHPNLDMIYLGLVTHQTPFGQSNGLGYIRNNLRRATDAEVRKALACIHEEGSGYVPKIQPWMSTAKYALIKLNWRRIATRQRKAVLARHS